MSGTGIEMSEASLWRQVGFFDPNIVKKPIKVYVVGAGALGSHIVDILASIGIRDITVYDFDNVEIHNIPNQVYKLSDVGTPKVEALARHVKAKMGYDINPINKKLTSLQDDGINEGYLIVATDTMKANLSLLTQARETKVRAAIEAKMSVSNGLVYFFKPQSPFQFKRWRENWADNDPEGIVACSERACAVNIHLIAGLAAGCVMLDNLDEPLKAKFPIYHQTEVFINGSVVRSNWGLDEETPVREIVL